MPKNPDTHSNKIAWIEAGFQFLAKGGIDSVRIDRMSKKIGLTRGSFYWHFKSRDELLNEMLKFWEHVATTSIIALIEQEHQNPNEKLATLIKLSTQQPDEKYGGKYAELGIRIWGGNDDKVAAIVAKIDGKRIAYVKQLLVEMKLETTNAAFLAEIIYNAFIGVMSRDLNEKQIKQITDLASNYIRAQIMPD